MDLSFDPKKRDSTLEDRGLDFADAIEVFEGDVLLEQEDERRDYGETRVVTVGHPRGRMVVICWTPRGDVRHIISMRKANGREQARFGQRSGEG